jgi:hypothetical protein
MAWRRKTKKTPPPVKPKPKAPPPPPADQGPRRYVLPDGTIEEISAATGRSIIVPGTPARAGLDVRTAAPDWGGLREIRRRLLGW